VPHSNLRLFRSTLQALYQQACLRKNNEDPVSMFKNIMERPLWYNLWSSIHFLPRLNEIKKEIRQDGRPDILDLGCGTGLFKKNYPDCNYVGMDTNVRYIDHARKTLAGDCILGDILQPEKYLGRRRFDYIISNGVLHHLDDASVTRLMECIGDYLKPGGRIIVVDHIFHERLNPINTMLLRGDRGMFSRTEAAYRKLFQGFVIASYKEFFIKAGPVVMWIQCRFVLQQK
jgi:SAM-dependent methyltransferase